MLSRKLRNDFASASTGPGPYYGTKGAAIFAFDDVLQSHGLTFNYSDTNDLYGDAGHKACNVHECSDCDDPGKLVGRASISWHRMGSGRYEFIGYLV